MSLETRSNSALFKRAEQLKRWEESDTNREPAIRKQKPQKVKFSSGCVFLAACASSDKEEVLRLLEKGADIDTCNVDGLTALHQACIDDNLDMVEFLIEHGADINKGDNEGWTPLHATASCGFLSIAKFLIENGANIASVNNDGELPLDIAECEDMEDLLQTEIDEQGIDCNAARSEEERLMLKDANEWNLGRSSFVNMADPKTGATPLHVAAAKGYINVMSALLKCGAEIDKQDVDGWTPLHAASHWGQKESAQILSEHFADMDCKNYVGQTAFDVADIDMLRYLEDLQKQQNKEEVINRRISKKKMEVPADIETPTKLKRIEFENEEKHSKGFSEIEKKISNSSNDLHENMDNVSSTRIINQADPPLWRKNISRPSSKEEINNFANTRSRVNSADNVNEDDVVFRKSNNFHTEKENTTKEQEADSTPITSTSSSVTTSSSNSPTSNSLPGSIRSNTDVTTSSSGTRLAIIKNFFKSFVPPVRDEESETQRKAHAKRVRETRRSTQGVTLEEIKSAEQFVKKKNASLTNNNVNSEQLGNKGNSSNGVSVTATITTAAPTIPTRSEDPLPVYERRPSWRLRIDNGSKFKLEDVNQDTDPPVTPLFQRRTSTNANSNSQLSANPIIAAETTVTIPLRKIQKNIEDKEQDKENDARTAQATLATQAAIQRRRRPKRRSTGVVAFDNLDDMDTDKNQCTGSDNLAKVNNDESCTEISTKSLLGNASDRGENTEINYKKLYEQTLQDNEKLKEKLRKSDEELRETKQTLEKLNTVTSKNSLSELEKRERRAMERKLSEMEEELKQLQKLKAENERLRAENRALTRVVSKLTNSSSK